MSKKSKTPGNLKKTMDLMETNPDVKSFIYQQVTEFEPFVTPETLILVVARNPKEAHPDLDEDIAAIATQSKHRIAIVLKEGDTSIESEAYNDDIYAAIRGAKDDLIERLVAIRAEVESPQERMNAIKQASAGQQLH